MSSFSPWPKFEKKVHEIQEGLVIGIVDSHGLAWAKWTSTIVVFHKRIKPHGSTIFLLMSTLFMNVHVFFYHRNEMKDLFITMVVMCVGFCYMILIQGDFAWVNRWLVCKGNLIARISVDIFNMWVAQHPLIVNMLLLVKKNNSLHWKNSLQYDI